VIIHSVVCGGERGGASSPGKYGGRPEFGELRQLLPHPVYSRADGGSILEVMKSVTPVVKLEVEEHMAQFTNPGISGVSCSMRARTCVRARTHPR